MGSAAQSVWHNLSFDDGSNTRCKLECKDSNPSFSYDAPAHVKPDQGKCGCKRFTGSDGHTVTQARGQVKFSVHDVFSTSLGRNGEGGKERERETETETETDRERERERGRKTNGEDSTSCGQCCVKSVWKRADSG